MYHISDVKKFNRCVRLFQHSLNETGTSFNYFVRKDNDVTDLAMKKLNITTCFKGEVNDDQSLALNALKTEEWLVKARFEYMGLRVKVPFLHKVDDKWDLYFLYIGNYPHEDDSLFYAGIIWVLENNGIKLNNLYIIHLNSAYIREDELNIDELFIISESFYNKNNNPGNLLNDVLFNHKIDFDSILKKMDFYGKQKLVEPVMVKACSKFGKCLYYNTCFNEEFIEDNAITTLVSSQNKYEMSKRGIKYLKDVDIDLIEGTRKQFAQIRADINGGLFVDKTALNAWWKKLKFPLIFLDFEWETYAIPPYAKMKPYDVLPFEYSIHIYDGKNVIHKDYVGYNDTREDLIINLLKDIPDEGSIIAYNGEAAEKIRIKELAEYKKEYFESLHALLERIVDLQFPFESGIVYDVRMRGQYSLKTLMNILDEKGYSSLTIHQGMDAVYSWRKIVETTDEAEKQKIIAGLKEYCGMDTYAMLTVYKWLKNLT